jgi:hypothetical protein
MNNDELIKHIKGIRYVVINNHYGGFGLSLDAEREYCRLEGIDPYEFGAENVRRDDLYLVKVVREMGDKANGKFASLKIVEIPADVDWQIEEYDGKEWIAEKHRIWE